MYSICLNLNLHNIVYSMSQLLVTLFITLNSHLPYSGFCTSGNSSLTLTSTLTSAGYPHNFQIPTSICHHFKPRHSIVVRHSAQAEAKVHTPPNFQTSSQVVQCTHSN